MSRTHFHFWLYSRSFLLNCSCDLKGDPLGILPGGTFIRSGASPRRKLVTRFWQDGHVGRRGKKKNGTQPTFSFLFNFLFVWVFCFCFFLWPQLVTLGLLLAGSRGPMGSNPGWLHLRQTPYILCYCSGPSRLIFCYLHCKMQARAGKTGMQNECGLPQAGPVLSFYSTTRCSLHRCRPTDKMWLKF